MGAPLRGAIRRLSRSEVVELDCGRLFGAVAVRSPAPAGARVWRGCGCAFCRAQCGGCRGAAVETGDGPRFPEISGNHGDQLAAPDQC